MTEHKVEAKKAASSHQLLTTFGFVLQPDAKRNDVNIQITTRPQGRRLEVRVGKSFTRVGSWTSHTHTHTPPGFLTNASEC